tara:strand:+ start:8446 stop:8547 length:102 start_codon:yes stop_codon:yes gene_type:complete
MEDELETYETALNDMSDSYDKIYITKEETYANI